MAYIPYTASYSRHWWYSHNYGYSSFCCSLALPSTYWESHFPVWYGHDRRAYNSLDYKRIYNRKLQGTYVHCVAACALKEARGGKDLNLIVSDYESKTLSVVFAVRLLTWSFLSETSKNRTISTNFLGTVWMVKSTLTPGAAGRNRTYDGGWPLCNIAVRVPKAHIFYSRCLTTWPLLRKCLSFQTVTISAHLWGWFRMV